MSLSDAPSWRLRPSAVGRGGGDYPNCRRRPRPPILVAIARRAGNIRPVAGIAVDQGQPGLDLKRNENIIALTPDPFAAANLVDARNQRRSACSSGHSSALKIGIEEYQEVGPDLFSPRACARGHRSVQPRADQRCSHLLGRSAASHRRNMPPL
jgi:hypothetical protein